MTEPTDSQIIVQKYVLVFDFCSSTSILENLKDYEPEAWWNLLVEVERFLTAEQPRNSFDIYKFIGDGWILVFDINYPVSDLFKFMVKLHKKYDELLAKLVTPLLTEYITPLGITFGLDKGNLIYSEIGGRHEYVGRAINVSSRMQGTIKAEDENPRAKVLTSRPVLNKEKDTLTGIYRTRPVVVELRNVSGGEQYRGLLLSLFETPHENSVRWNTTGLTLDNTYLRLDTDRLLNCTFDVEFSIDSDHGDPTHWFGVRLRGRGEDENIFDGYLVYLRSNGNLDLRSLSQHVLTVERQVVDPPINTVKMRISIIDEQLSVWINDKLIGTFSASGVMRSGRVYLHAAKTKVTIKSAQLLSEETI